MTAHAAKTVRRKPTKAKKQKAAAPATQISSGQGVGIVEDIRVRAYLRWEAAGKPPGDGVPFWLEAQQELGATDTPDGARQESVVGGQADVGSRFPLSDMDPEC